MPAMDEVIPLLVPVIVGCFLVFSIPFIAGLVAGGVFGSRYRKTTDETAKQLPVIQKTAVEVTLTVEQAFQKAIESLGVIQAKTTSVDQSSYTINARTGVTV